MRSLKKILVFTGGGIAPALNATLVGVIRRAQELNLEIYGGFKGWASLTDTGKIVPLHLSDKELELLSQTGGTFLETARYNPFEKDDHVWENIRNFDGIIPIGGDDTLGAAAKFFERGINIVGVPKTIDNDLAATFFTPGFPTAADLMARIAKSVKIAALTRGKFHLIETLGGKAGWLTAATAVGGADIIIPPERPVTLRKVFDRIDQILDTQAGVVIALSHYADLGLKSEYTAKQDDYGLSRPYLVSLELRKALEDRYSSEVKVVVPGNYPSGADPNQVDRATGMQLGSHAVDLLVQGNFGRMASVNPDLQVDDVPLATACRAYKSLTPAEFDFDALWPTENYFQYIEKVIGRREEEYFALLSSLRK